MVFEKGMVYFFFLVLEDIPKSFFFLEEKVQIEVKKKKKMIKFIKSPKNELITYGKYRKKPEFTIKMKMLPNITIAFPNESEFLIFLRDVKDFSSKIVIKQI